MIATEFKDEHYADTSSPGWPYAGSCICGGQGDLHHTKDHIGCDPRCARAALNQGGETNGD